MKKIIVFNGMHSAGKTAMASEFARRNNLIYYYEIGKQLRHEIDYLSLTSFDEYDTEIMNREFTRDQELLQTTTLPIIETWHVGDMAYAMQRSPKILPFWKEKFKDKLNQFDPLCILLQISDDTFRKRAVKGEIMDNFEQMLAFYKKIITDTVALYQEFNIPYIKVSNDGEFEQGLNEASRYILDKGYVEKISL